MSKIKTKTQFFSSANISAASIQFVTTSGSRDLSTVGAKEGTTLKLTVEISPKSGTFDPQTLVAISKDTKLVSKSAGDPATATIRVTLTSGAVNFKVKAKTPSKWPSRNVTANRSIKAIGIVNIAEFGQRFSELDGMTIATNAQLFKLPDYVPPTRNGTPKIRIRVAAPHFLPDGKTVNTGQFKAFIPSSVVSKWNVSSPSQLTASTEVGGGSLNIKQVNGGLRIELTNYHYSEGNITITTQQTPNISVTEYSVSTTSIQTGKSLSITATLNNTGSASGSKNVTFYTDGTAAATKNVAVSANSTTTVTQSVSFSSMGAHTVSVENLSTTSIDVNPNLSPVGPFGSAPTDPDNDNQYEDVNGNGIIDVGDVTALFKYRGSGPIATTPRAFDIDGQNDGVTVNDVVALFDELAA